MGLIKEIQTKSGFSVSYWKITDWKINQTINAIDIILTPYISNFTRKNGYEPVRDEVRKIRVSDYFIEDNHPNNRTEYSDYFSPEALERAAKQGKTIYNVMYEYVVAHAPEFALAIND